MSSGLDIRPVAGALGAEIEGVDLSRPLTDNLFAAVRQAFLDYEAVFFRGQDGLDPDAHKAFGRRFGTLNVHPYVTGMQGHPEILEIIKEPEERTNFGGGWHSDMSFLEQPALGSMLLAVETPPYGGDTLFASQTAAYEALTDGMKAMLAPLKAVHSAAREYSAKGQSAMNRKSMDARTAQDAPEYEHPVVRTHPETGQKGLYVNPAFTLRFAGMTKRESKPLLDFLFAHCREERFTCRWRWSPGDLAFWDNRRVWHYALNDYQGQRRHMRRVTIDGERPV